MMKYTFGTLDSALGPRPKKSNARIICSQSVISVSATTSFKRKILSLNSVSALIRLVTCSKIDQLFSLEKQPRLTIIAKQMTWQI